MAVRTAGFLAGAMAAGTVTLLAQWAGGAGFGGGVPNGWAGGPGGPTLARVNVAPVGGGGWSGGLGAGGFSGQAAGVGGVFGVTRRTFMSEANVAAGQFFSNAGVPLPGAIAGTPTPPVASYASRFGPGGPLVQRPVATGTPPAFYSGSRGSRALAGRTPASSSARLSAGGSLLAPAFPSQRGVVRAEQGEAGTESPGLVRAATSLPARPIRR